jgi:hypothetical protein
MTLGAVLVDVAIDQSGCSETSYRRLVPEVAHDRLGAVVPGAHRDPF